MGRYKNNVFEGQKSNDRHDIIARSLRLKVKQMLNVLTIVHVFGEHLAFTYSLKWQKEECLMYTLYCG